MESFSEAVRNCSYHLGSTIKLNVQIELNLLKAWTLLFLYSKSDPYHPWFSASNHISLESEFKSDMTTWMMPSRLEEASLWITERVFVNKHNLRNLRLVEADDRRI